MPIYLIHTYCVRNELKFDLFWLNGMYLEVESRVELCVYKIKVLCKGVFQNALSCSKRIPIMTTSYNDEAELEC